MRLDGKHAIVTGASRGIGKAIAKRLAADGAKVIVNYVSRQDAAEAVVQEIIQAGGNALAVQADVSKLSGIEHLFQQAEQAFGAPDILVNNAGAILYKPVVEVSEAEFDQLFALNVKGSFFASQMAARRLKDGGVIINFSSSTTALMLPTYGTYVATKGAVEQFSHVLAKELGQRQIRVNVVSPGPTDTDLFNQGKTEADKQRLAEMAALGRLGLPEDIADTVAFLVSDEARWVTGQNIRVNGGLI